MSVIRHVAETGMEPRYSWKVGAMTMLASRAHMAKTWVKDTSPRNVPGLQQIFHVLDQVSYRHKPYIAMIT